MILVVEFDPVEFFSSDKIFVGFTAGTGQFADNHDIMDFCLEQSTTDTCDQTMAPTSPAPTTPAPITPAPTTPAPTLAVCPPDETVGKGKLNKCAEQEKCFSITYKKMEDKYNVCDEAGCDFKWKVCLNINDNNPCCQKEKKNIFKKACVRGDLEECLDDEDSLKFLDPIENLRVGDEFCEIVAPGEKALFQLVSVYGKDGLGTHHLT